MDAGRRVQSADSASSDRLPSARQNVASELPVAAW